jgi:NAD(P)-dependent dehydrogenase (short-subunit alcohol dehydrogenase family)
MLDHRAKGAFKADEEIPKSQAMTDEGRDVVVVTGASTGIGRACALHLSARGFEVLAGVRRDEDAARLREAGQANGRLTPLHLDVTDEASVEAAGATVADATGARGLAGLVNNAGVATGGPLEFLPLEDVRRQLEVNLVGQIAVTQAVLAPLRRRHGRIVNMGSVGGRTPPPFAAPYAASKAALRAASEALRRELRPWRIWVATVQPGSIATPIWEKGTATAHDARSRLPDGAERLYGDVLDRTDAITEKMAAAGIPPERVARVVERALTARRPRRDYVVGRDAKAQIALDRVLPTRAFDGLMRRVMGI